MNKINYPNLIKIIDIERFLRNKYNHYIFDELSRKIIIKLKIENDDLREYNTFEINKMLKYLVEVRNSYFYPNYQISESLPLKFLINNKTNAEDHIDTIHHLITNNKCNDIINCSYNYIDVLEKVNNIDISTVQFKALKKYVNHGYLFGERNVDNNIFTFSDFERMIK